MTEVSVIIPTRDRPQFLRQAVASVVAQRGVQFELIIVNDGSENVPPFPDPRVRIIDNGQRGAVAARNLGVASATGKFIAFLDDDDWWTDDRHLSWSLASGADFTFSDGEMIFMDGSPPLEFARDASAATLALDNTILISSVCYRASLHDRLGIFDESLPYYWDWDWCLRVAQSGADFRHLAINTAAIRVHDQNMSGAELVRERQGNLDAFASKHGLGQLRLKNHLDIARELPSTI